VLLASCGGDRYVLTLSTEGQGTAAKSPDQSSYAPGTEVTLTAAPTADGWYFWFWHGVDMYQGDPYLVMENPHIVVINRDMDVTARFDQAHAIIVNIEGKGKVSKSPDQALYPPGTQVTLTATPANGWTFDSWTSAMGLDQPKRTNPWTIRTYFDGEDWVVTAHFMEVPRFALTVNTVGRGTVSKSPEQDTYMLSELVELTATPKNGWVFDHWESDSYVGPLRGNPITAIVGEAATVWTAYFVEAGTQSPVTTVEPGTTIPVTTTAQGYTLNVSVVNQSPPGSGGTVAISPDQAAYAPGTVVTLTATPATNFRFSHWEGAASGTNPTITITMNGNKSVTAVFYFPIE